MRQTLLDAWSRRGPLARLLWPLSVLYGGLTGLRRFLYRVGVFKAGQAGVPVVVVGNVIAGGAGKTPVVMALVQHLQARGWQVGVVSRGHGRHSTDCREVHPDDHPGDVGDEPALIRRRCNAPVFVASRRWQAARALLQAYPRTQLIVCDDGLQHLALQRELEICVFDDRGTGNGWLLPAGPLREPWPRPVDLVLHTGARPAFAGFHAHRALASHAVRADGSTVPLSSLGQAGAPPLAAVAAIAQPGAFFGMLREAGVPLAYTVALPDHYDFDSWRPPTDGGQQLICTEKDAVKLWRNWPHTLAVPLELSLAPAFLDALDDQLAKLSSVHGHTPS